MNCVEKYVLKPFTDDQKVNINTVDHKNMCILALKLAENKSFNEKLEMFDKSGSYNGDITTPLLYATNQSEQQKGSDRFLHLLASANVDSKLISNESLRIKYDAIKDEKSIPSRVTKPIVKWTKL